MYQSNMLNVPELTYLISRKYGSRVKLTACFKAWGSLLMVAMWSRDIQQAIGMLRMAWDSLNPKNWFTTFLEFLQLCFLFCTPLASLFLVCNCPLCIQEWIRVTILYQISLNYNYWFMIWSLWKIFPNQANSIFLCPFEPCTIWCCFQLCNDPKHAHNLNIWLAFDIFTILYWFYLI